MRALEVDMLGLRSVAQSCMGKSGTLSMLEDVHGFYRGGFGPSVILLSLRDQLTRISTKPFVKVAMFHVWPKGTADDITFRAHVDMRRASEVYETECGVWIYVTSASPIYTDRFGPDVTIEFDDGRLSEDEEDLVARNRTGDRRSPASGGTADQQSMCTGLGDDGNCRWPV
jgi:hypothetical protein